MNYSSEINSVKHYHCYATANDNRFYFRDIHNLKKLQKSYSGLNNVILYIAISEVNKQTIIDKLFKKMVSQFFYNHPSITLIEIFFKSNIGRDFSSYHQSFIKINQTANPSDFIFFQNRSGYGPYQSFWYERFIKQYEKFENIAICGSTINFYNNSDRSPDNNFPHVQTYSFLTKVSHLNMFNGEFPGIHETKKDKIVCKGEIYLSHYFLKQGFKITCIEWPELPISIDSRRIIKKDIKGNPNANHFFYHWAYFRNNKKSKINIRLNAIISWLIFLVKLPFFEVYVFIKNPILILKNRISSKTEFKK